MKKMILAIFAILAITGQFYAMQPMAAKITVPLLKNFAKKGFSGAMTGLHWFIAAGGSINMAYQREKILYNEKETLKTLANANEEITQFILLSSEKTHNIQIDGIKIDPAMDIAQTPMATLRKHILLSQSTADAITCAIENNDETVLNKWLGVLEHENNHTKNNDLIWRTIADVTLPFVTHGSIKVIRNALPIAQKTRPFLREQFMKIPTAMGKEIMTGCSRMTVYRHQEQRADDEVSNDLDKLNGLKNLFNNFDEQQRQSLINTLQISPENIDYVRLPLSFLQEHPLPTKRIEKLDERIALLKKESEQSDKNEEISL